MAFTVLFGMRTKTNCHTSCISRSTSVYHLESSNFDHVLVYYNSLPLVAQFLGFKCECPPNFKGAQCEERSLPGPPSDPCDDITCGKEEACVVIETGKDGGYKCEPCKTGESMKR